MYFNQLESDKLQARRKARRKENERRRKQYRKQQAKREFARKHDGLNSWQVASIYAVFALCGGGALFFWFWSILSMGV